MTNDWVMSAVTIVGSVVGNVAVGSYFVGKLTQKVAGHEKTLDEHSRKFETLEYNHEAKFKEIDDRHEKDSSAQWKEVNALGKDVFKVKGHLGINGGYHG